MTIQSAYEVMDHPLSLALDNRHRKRMARFRTAMRDHLWTVSAYQLRTSISDMNEQIRTVDLIQLIKRIR